MSGLWPDGIAGGFDARPTHRTPGPRRATDETNPPWQNTLPSKRHAHAGPACDASARRGVRRGPCAGTWARPRSAACSGLRSRHPRSRSVRRRPRGLQTRRGSPGGHRCGTGGWRARHPGHLCRQFRRGLVRAQQPGRWHLFRGSGLPDRAIFDGRRQHRRLRCRRHIATHDAGYGITLEDSIIDGNTATTIGGGVYAEGRPGGDSFSRVVISHNTAGVSGRGI